MINYNYTTKFICPVCLIECVTRATYCFGGCVNLTYTHNFFLGAPSKDRNRRCYENFANVDNAEDRTYLNAMRDRGLITEADYTDLNNVSRQTKARRSLGYL